MVASSGAVLLVATAVLGEFIGPPLDFYARDMRMEARYESDEDFGNDAWVKDGPVYLHLERVNSEFEFGSLYLFRFKTGTLRITIWHSQRRKSSALHPSVHGARERPDIARKTTDIYNTRQGSLQVATRRHGSEARGEACRAPENVGAGDSDRGQC